MAKKWLIVTAALLIFVGAFALRESKRESAAEGGAAPALEHAEPTPAPALPRLIDLGSTQCIPCKKMAPILEHLVQAYGGSFTVEFIDVRQNPDAGSAWGIRLIPTQIFLDADGEELFRHEGFMGQEAILAKWAELGYAPRRQAPAAQF